MGSANLQDVIAIALIVELLTQWANSFGKHALKATPDKHKRILAKVVAYVLGLGLAFLFHVDIFNSLGLHTDSLIVHILGMIISGCISGRGGHFINELIYAKYGRGIHNSPPYQPQKKDNEK